MVHRGSFALDIDIKDAEKIYEMSRKKPRKTFWIIIVLVLGLIYFGLKAYIGGYFGERGKQDASPSKQTAEGLTATTPETKDKAGKANTEVRSPTKSEKQGAKETKEPKGPDSKQSTVIQKTEGDQSPAVNVGPGGKSTIIYGEPKKEGGK